MYYHDAPGFRNTSKTQCMHNQRMRKFHLENKQSNTPTPRQSRVQILKNQSKQVYENEEEMITNVFKYDFDDSLEAIIGTISILHTKYEEQYEVCARYLDYEK